MKYLKIVLIMCEALLMALTFDETKMTFTNKNKTIEVFIVCVTSVLWSSEFPWQKSDVNETKAKQNNFSHT